MTNKIYGLDWAHKSEKQFWYNGTDKPTTKQPKLNRGDTIVTENVPEKQLVEFLEQGAKVLSTQTNKVKDWLQAHDLEKNDSNDSIAVYEIYKDDPNGFWEREPKSDLYNIYEIFKEIQHIKVMLKLRDFANGGELNKHTMETFQKEEDFLKKALAKKLKEYPIWNEWLVDVKGIGPSISGGLISFIDNIKRFDNISKLWAYFGMHTVEGTAPKKKRGQTSNWNQKCRAICFNISDQFIKQHKKLKGIYDTEKEKQLVRPYQAGELFKKYGKPYVEDDINLRRLHAHMRAKRKIAKIFLACLWIKWRELEGLETTQPFACDKLNHNGIIKPDDLV